jgi:hypothetical protein
MTDTRQRVPHQLIVHLDWHPNGILEIRYNYPFSWPHTLREQLIRFSPDEVPSHVSADLGHLRSALRARLNVASIRVPHDTIVPTVQEGILTVVTRDQRRDLPVMRLYCYEVAEKLETRVERELRKEASDCSPDHRATWERVRQWTNGKAWADFQNK